MSPAFSLNRRPRLRRIAFLLFALLSLCCAAGWLRPLAAQATSNWTLDGVLAMLDKSAQDFHSLTADIEHIKYTAVVKDSSAETGPIFERFYATAIHCSFSRRRSVALKNTTSESTARSPTSIWRSDSAQRATRLKRITL